MNILKNTFRYFQAKYTGWRAKKLKHFRTEEIVKVLTIAHAAELASTPGELWNITKQRQAQQISAVRDGNIDIVDRRSWQFPYLPSSISRIRQPILKMTPVNIRRFSKSPVPRRAINLIKNSVIALEWDILPIKGTADSVDDDTISRINSAKTCFNHPNLTDSYQSLVEQCLEDFLILGAMSVEPQLTPDPERPFKLWSVDTSTIRMFPTWTESDVDTEPHYAQMTGLLGERGIVPFMDNELLYLRDNPSNDTPFGLGKMEVAFQAVNAFLGVQEMSSRAGADQIHKTWLWWSGSISAAHTDQIRRHITNDQEGQAKISLVTGMQKPEVVEVTPVSEADLLLNWQQLLIRLIALAFDMSAANFLERDVNRSTGEVLQDSDFRSAVVPVAVKLAEGFTRFFLHRLLGWKDLEFKFINLDDPDLQTKVKIAQQSYAMNALTANEFRASLGKPPLATPLANLTQIELILLNTEATAKIQNSSADKAAQRQLTTQQKQMEMYQQSQGGQGQLGTGEQDKESGGEDQQASASTGLLSPKVPAVASIKSPKLTTPKAPSLVKLPMAGCSLNAQQVAGMSVDALSAAIQKGLVTSDIGLLCDQMETQEPGILEQVSEELKTYLEQLQKVQQDNADAEDDEISPKDRKDQLKKFKDFQHQQGEVERDYNVSRTGYPNSRATQEQNTSPILKVATIKKKKRKLKNTNSRNTPVVEG